VAHARQACRRLRRRAPGARILVGLWGGQLDHAKDSDPAGSMGADLTAASFAQAVERVERLAVAPRGHQGL
jgi:hypothetical protein